MGSSYWYQGYFPMLPSFSSFPSPSATMLPSFSSFPSPPAATMAAAATDSSKKASSKKKITLNLLVDMNEQKVLFAEADKDFVDFLFSLLLLPFGTVNRLLNGEAKSSNSGCWQNLRRSVENLNNQYMQSKHAKDLLLNPESLLSCIYPQAHDLLPLGESPPPSSSSSTTLPLTTSFRCLSCPNVYSSFPQNCPYCHLAMPRFSLAFPPVDSFYSCNKCPGVFCSSPRACPSCNSTTVRLPVLPPTAPPPSDAEGGFVKGMAKYMVTDDLVVKPMSNLSSISLMKQKVEKMEALEEIVVEVDKDDGLDLLKKASSSNTVLSDVFLHDFSLIHL